MNNKLCVCVCEREREREVTFFVWENYAYNEKENVKFIVRCWE